MPDHGYTNGGKKEEPCFKLGGFQLSEAKSMCAQCPLAKNSKAGNLGGYTVWQYLYILSAPVGIACHMSKGFPNDYTTQRPCTGVLFYRQNVGFLKGNGSTLAFEHPQEFIDHHIPENHKWVTKP